MVAMTNRERYLKYDASPEAIKKRSKRVLARRAYEKEHGPIAKGMDVHHKVDLDQGGTNAASNLTLKSTKENRGVLRVKTNGGGKRR
jgi:hypothetical protein